MTATVKIRAQALKRAALDWAVAKCEGETLSQASLAFQIKKHGCLQRPHLGSWEPTCSWSQGGPIIERQRLNLRASIAGDWVAMTHDVAHPDRVIQYGDTPLIAAMRCYVASKLGNEIEVPYEVSK